MSEEEQARRARIEAGVVAVREGPSANCSSIGSVVDTLFLTAALGGAVFAAVAAAVSEERSQVRIIGDAPPEGGDTRDDDEATRSNAKGSDAPPA